MTSDWLLSATLRPERPVGLGCSLRTEVHLETWASKQTVRRPRPLKFKGNSQGLVLYLSSGPSEVGNAGPTAPVLMAGSSAELPDKDGCGV